MHNVTETEQGVDYMETLLIAAVIGAGMTRNGIKYNLQRLTYLLPLLKK